MLHGIVPQGFSGVIWVQREDRPLFQQACGYADRANEIPNRLDTRFATASAGKAFVAAGILRLTEQGRLSLDTAIGSVLDFPLSLIDPEVTVEQLLNHTSGIPDYFDESVMSEYADLFRDFPNYRIRTSRDLLPLFVDKPMMCPRGQRFQYNNSGYVVLGLIIESVTGQPFDAWLRAEVFSPLGMSDTGYYELDRLPARCANAYILDEQTGQYYTNIYSVDAKGTGAGGAFTTAADVARFWQGLLGGAVISPATFGRMISVRAQDGPYGYGFWLSQERRTPYFQGSDPGVSFLSSYDTQRRQIVTLISNLGQDIWSLHQDIDRVLDTL